ncbi:reverse transcriptase-like protein, partial [Klebsiella pneumoniae]|nr:reverse transcriptase-like protein [Klebsiella pneumoniae]
REIKVFGDSQLVINQIAGTYKVLKPRLLEYHRYAMKLLQQIPVVTLTRIPRGLNATTDALAKLAKELACLEEESIPVEVQNRQVLSPIDLQYLQNSITEGEIDLANNNTVDDWRQPFIEYLQEGKLPREKSLAHQIKQRSMSYTLVNNTLYRRSYDQLWLRCLGKDEAHKIVTEVHAGLCGAHQSGPKMKMKIKR